MSTAEEKIIFDESTEDKLSQRKKKLKKDLAHLVIFGVIMLPFLILFFALSTSIEANYEERFIIVILGLAGFILCLLNSIRLYGYDNLRLSEKGIYLPNKEVSQVLRGKKNFVPYEDITYIYIGSKNFPFVWIRFNRYMKNREYWINIKQEIVDIERFTEILKEKKIKVYMGAIEDKIPSVSVLFSKWLKQKDSKKDEGNKT